MLPYKSFCLLVAINSSLVAKVRQVISNYDGVTFSLKIVYSILYYIPVQNFNLTIEYL